MAEGKNNSEVSFEQIHSIIYSILLDIDECCNRNGITYFLSGGTLLGAIRHKGFIPWDDDGDIMLPRDDYEKFFDCFKKEYGEKYGIGALSISPEWTTPYGIIWDKSTVVKSKNLDQMEVGLGVDVFPIDGLSDSARARKLFMLKMKTLNGMRNACLRKDFLPGEKQILLKKFAKQLLKPFGARYFAERMDRLSSSIKIGETTKVGSTVAIHYGDKETIDIKSIEKAVDVEFEGTVLKAPVGYHQYLSRLYGDYMTIPKEIKQKGATHLDHWEVNINQ